MCFDPVSLAMLAGGSALSVGGGIMNQNAQTSYNNAVAQDNANAAAASNNVLNSFMTTQAANQATNTANLQPTYNRIAPGTMQSDQKQIAAKSIHNANDAIAQTLGGSSTSPMEPTYLSGTDGAASADEIAKRTAARTGQSVLDATNAAKLDAYGTNFANMGLVETAGNRNIDTMNQTAQREAALLPSDQANAALQARQFIAPPDTMTGTAVQGIGNIFAAAGGSGIAKSGINNWFGNGAPTPTVTNPGIYNWNQMGPTGFSVGGA